MSFEWLVALRYLRSPHRPAVLRLISWLALLGVAAGVATLVIALAMNTGFRRVLRDRLLGVTAHINLKPISTSGIRDYRQLMQKIDAVTGVRSAAPAIYNTVLLSSGANARGTVLKGVDPALETKTDEAMQRITAGSANFAPDSQGIQGVLVGKIMAADTKVKVGDYVTMTSPQGSLTPFGMIPKSKRFRIVGIFDSGFYDYDANWGIVSLATAQELADIGDVVSLLEIRVDRLEDVDAIAERVKTAAGGGFLTTTWIDENRALFRALSLEKLVTALFIGLITFVAGLNILVVLAMTVIDKTRDIAVLMAMGARSKQIRRIFLLQGFLVGALGSAAGLLIGYVASWCANNWKLIHLNPEVYAIPYVPFHASALDAVWIFLAAMTICLAATLMPARAASRILPVEILRFE
jgi:lipoprotein-releasing system permease protein